MATYLFQCKDILFCYLSSILPLHFAKPFDQFNLQRDLQLHDCSFAKFLLLIIIYEKKKKVKKIDPSIKEYVGNKRGENQFHRCTDRGKPLFV